MVAVRIITGFTKHGETSPSAARTALVGVIAIAAEAPQIFHSAVAGVAHRTGALPNIFERVLTDIAACPSLSW